MKKTFSVLTVLILSTAIRVQASDLKCFASAAQLNGKFVNATATSIPTTPMPNSPDFLDARPTLKLEPDYQVEMIVRIKSQFDLTKPVTQFNDYSLWFDYTVFKLENGLKRAVGAGDEGEVSATASRSAFGCNSTICAAAMTPNMDVRTVLGNLANRLTPYEAYKKGILLGGTPGGFVISCEWNK